MRKTNFFTKIVGITTVVCSLFGFSASAQTIATDPVSSPFCAGSTFDVTYTSMGFSGQQIYFAELSDSTGTFGMNGMMDAIGTDMMGMGTVSVTIPDSVGSGIHYRIRVSAMDVQNFTTVNGTDNGMDIVINEIPKTNATASSMSLCLGMTDTLMANATGGATPYSYAWSPGSHADSDTAYFTPSTSGLKGWSVVVTDSNSCMSKSDTVWVTVNDLPMVSIMASAMTICAGTADTLMAMATGGAGEYSSYWWGPADSTTTDTAFIVMPMMGSQ